MIESLRHFFTPHHTNNQKARILHPQAFVFYILLVFVIQVSLKTVRTTFPDILGFATDISVTKLVDLTNQRRVSLGLAPLTLSPTLSAAAANKASDMFSKNYWAHIAPDGKTPWDFITGAGYHYVYAGENLAKNFTDSNGVVSAWMDSPSHRDNLLKKEYQEVGFAVVNGKLNGEDTTLVVQMFGAGSSPLVAQNPVAPIIIPTQIPQPTQASLATISPTVFVSPTLPIVPTLITQGAIANTQIRVAGARLTPMFNINSVAKSASLILIGFLLIILALDSIFIWRRKIVRISGHNFAHMLFLLMLIGVVYITGSGAIM